MYSEEYALWEDTARPNRDTIAVIPIDSKLYNAGLIFDTDLLGLGILCIFVIFDLT